MGYQEKYHHRKEDGKTSHWCVPCSAGPQHEDPPLRESAVPALTAESIAPAPSAHSTGPEVVILRSQCPHDHQLTGSACGFQMPCYLQNTLMIGKFGQDFIDLEEILNFLPRKNNFTDTKYNQVGGKSEN